IGGKSDGLRDRIANVLRNLSWGPELATRAAKFCRAIAGLHGGMGHERQLVGSLDLAAVHLRYVAGVVKGYDFAGRGFLQRVEDSGRVQGRVRALVPLDIQCTTAGHRAPYCVGDNGNGRIADFAHVADAGNLPGISIIETGDLAAKNRASSQNGVFHSWTAEVDAIFGGAVHFGRNVEPWKRLADELIIFRLFQRRIGGNWQAGGFAGQLPIAEAAVGVWVDDGRILGFATG